MGDKKAKTQKNLSDEEEMRKRYKLMLHLGLVEYVEEFDLLGADARKPDTGQIGGEKK